MADKQYGVWVDLDASLPQHDHRKPEFAETDDLINLYWILQNQEFLKSRGASLAGISVCKGNNPSLGGARSSLIDFLEETGYDDVLGHVVTSRSSDTNSNQRDYRNLVQGQLTEAKAQYADGLILLVQGPTHNVRNLKKGDLEAISPVVMWGHKGYRKKLGHKIEWATPLTGLALDAYNLSGDVGGAQSFHANVSSLINWTVQATASLQEEDIARVENPYVRDLLTLRSEGHAKQFSLIPRGGVYVWDLFFGLTLLDKLQESSPGYQPTFETRREDATVSRNLLGAPRVLADKKSGHAMDLAIGVDQELYRKRAVAGLNGKLHEAI